MPVKNITDLSDTELVSKMDALKNQVDRASLAFARVIAESFHRELWAESGLKVEDFYATHGVSKEDPLPTKARREVIELTPAATLKQHITLTGASKATVARDRSLLEITDPKVADAIAKGKGNAEGSNGGQNGDRSKAVAEAPESGDAPEFDLSALLSALDDNELRAVVGSLTVDTRSRLTAILATV